MSRLDDQSRQSATALAVIVLILALLSALEWKVDRVFNHSLPVLGTVHAATPAPSSARLPTDYGKLPISFEANQGQTDKSVQFLARGAGYTLFLTPGEAVLSLHAPPADAGEPGHPAVPRTLLPVSRQVPSTTPGRPPASIVRLQLIGANTAAEATGVDRLPGNSNYFIGSDPARWQTDVPTYAKVRYRNVYPGIDLLYYGNQEGRLEHDFVVVPGADPNAIAIGLRGSDGAVPDENGGIILHTKTGDLTLRSPVAYQTIGDQRRTIPASYLLADNQIRFQLGSYDINEPLVIDPVLRYTAILGGSDRDGSQAIAVDGSGNAYVTGYAYSTDFPLVHPFQTSGVGAFVSKINSAGTALLYSTYLGGPDTVGNGIAVDHAGRAYVVGRTLGGLPVKNGYEPIPNDFDIGMYSAFISVFSTAGDSLVYSTYFGSGPDDGIAVALDSSGNAYLLGWANTSTDIPMLHSIRSSGGGGFVAKFNGTGVLQYSSIFNGFYARPQAIAVDAFGAAYVTGYAIDTGNTYGLSVTTNAFQKTCPKDHGCGFVAKLTPSGDTLAYSTFLGVGQYIYTVSSAVAVDSSGSAYVAGTTGPGFPVHKTGFQNTYRGGTSDGFVAKLNASGSDLIWSTYLGGSAQDYICDLALDQYRQVYVTGFTASPDFPLKAPLQTHAGSGAAFVTTLSGSLGSIVYYSTYFGTYMGWNSDYTSVRIAVDKPLNVYLTGRTFGAIQPTPGALNEHDDRGLGDFFISKLVIMDDLILGVSASPSLSVTHGSNLTYTLAATSKGPDFGYNVRIDDPLPAGTTFVSFAASRGTCTAPAVGATGTLHCQLQRLEKGDTFVVALTVKVNAPAGSTLSNTATAVSNMQDFVPSNNKATYTSKVN